MTSTICLDENYSTTRMLITEQPVIKMKADQKFETILFLPEGERRQGEGGLRTEGYFKKSYEDTPLVSIITVVYNGEKYLEETILSVINQTYDNVEYIIIDGGSTDGTLDIIKKYEDWIDYWVSEKDKGIYDAMNKGIRVASGKWINFMNAGDSFIDYSVLFNTQFDLHSNIALLYGNQVFRNKVNYPMEINKLKIGEIMACHQAMFFNKEILKEKLIYDLKYPIYADYELVNYIYCNNYLIKYIDLNIANFEDGGISSFVSTQKRKDKYAIVYKFYGLSGLGKAILYRIYKSM